MGGYVFIVKLVNFGWGKAGAGREGVLCVFFGEIYWVNWINEVYWYLWMVY